jgi:Asp/Glu/hydantoin racemase
MMHTLVMIHTLSSLVKVFTELGSELLPGVQLLHIVDEPLLSLVRRRGHLAAEDTARLQAHVVIAEQAGASAVLLTCSALSPCVDDVRPAVQIPVCKIDEAMIAEAVREGTRIGVVATNEATLGPTRRLLLDQARSVGKEVNVELVLVEHALQALLEGEASTHDRLVKEKILELSGRADIVLLAQASMARVLGIIPEEERLVPILSSPHLALAQVRRELSTSRNNIS